MEYFVLWNTGLFCGISIEELKNLSVCVCVCMHVCVCVFSFIRLQLAELCVFNVFSFILSHSLTMTNTTSLD